MVRFLSRLLAWYRSERRDLPWRNDPTPWRVLVSETMLQQTRVGVVAPRYEGFLSRFPTPATMAAATEEDVLALWSGLGYYRRARNLHAAARRIVEDHDGRVPDDRAALLALPGIGDYTAGAVLSIAFGRPEPVVDGNVERVLSRRFLVSTDVKRMPARRVIRELAGEAVRGGPPADVNQALMELGATICVSPAPRCGDCPVAESCLARAEGREAELPVLPARRSTVDLALGVALVQRGDRVLMARAPAGGLLAGTWAPPFVPVTGPDGDGPGLVRLLGKRYGLDLTVGEPMGTFAHSITHHRIRAAVYRCRLRGEPPDESARLLAPAEIEALGTSALARKTLALLAR